MVRGRRYFDAKNRESEKVWGLIEKRRGGTIKKPGIRRFSQNRSERNDNYEERERLQVKRKVASFLVVDVTV